jgi:chromosome segregation protein
VQLKRLQLIGFKTFADKTEIEFSDGMTAIVGPNGSGKSNIADALLWVLGEQNPRLLRGSDSRDVIFAGTDRRKPLGMAEVRLTLDNSDRSLPVDFAEVTVTRRVYRSGESHYSLNGAPCRLKDIVDLFLDTGMGKGAYSFVSQSEIDAVLSARPEDRRELFEEAAGIKKYRVRKREAVRKLEQAESNLTRIRDIVHELEQQRAPLAKQAEIAKRYLELQARLQEIEVGLLVAEVQKTDYELYAARRECELDQEAIQRYDADLALRERELTVIGDRLAEAEQQLDSARLNQQSAMTMLERTESQIQLVRERGQAAEQSAESLERELKELGERAAALQREIQGQQKAQEKAAAEEEARKTEIAAARARLKELEAALSEAMQRAEDRQGVLRRLAEQRAQREAALAACRSRLSETEARLNRLGEEAALLQTQQQETEKRLQETRKLLTETRQRQLTLQKQLTAREQERRAAQDHVSAARIALEAARRRLAERESRLATLTELQESGEGFYQGVRAALNAARQRKLPGRYTPVVDLLTVPEAYRVAVEVALGASAQDIVCETEAQAKAAIEWLKAHRAGRATFLALPMLQPALPIAEATIDGMPGLIGVAAKLVQADPRYTAVIQLLLGRVVIAQEMNAAVQAAKRLKGWGRIVTLEGELITPGGALTGGSLQGRGAHLVGRKGEIDDLNRLLPQLRDEVERQADALQQAQRRGEELEAAIASLRRELSEYAVKIAAFERDQSAGERERERLQVAQAEIAAEASRLNAAHSALTQETAEWTAAVAASHAEDTSADDAIADAQAQARQLAERREQARGVLTALEVETGRLSEKLTGIKRSLAASQEALRQLQSAREAKQAQRELAGVQWRDADNLLRELTQKREQARRYLAECEEQFARLRDQRQELLHASFEKTNAIKELTQIRSDTLQQMHDAELQIARLEVRLSQAAQRLMEEYSISLEEALQHPDSAEIDRDVAAEVTRLRRELRQMGQVNTGAADEYARLTERYEFLSGQRADLEKARESLLAAIAEIDASTRDIFMETFNAVSEEFSRLFKRLFNGGSTRLTLTTPEDLLETGIEVYAQPPGKKPQHLSLLSGGERALTAVALLFAFLAVRPSPFALLDEVDAPLDGANVEKFVQLVRDFTPKTQFVLITHNPTTMEAAPRWYGVTMREPGVSSLLSYRVPTESVPSEPETSLLLEPAPMPSAPGAH